MFLVILLMKELLHQLIGSLSIFIPLSTIHSRWCRISSTNMPFRSDRPSIKMFPLRRLCGPQTRQIHARWARRAKRYDDQASSPAHSPLQGKIWYWRKDIQLFLLAGKRMQGDCPPTENIWILAFVSPFGWRRICVTCRVARFTGVASMSICFLSESCCCRAHVTATSTV